jgi:phenylacetate-CoA ligase
MIWNQQVETLSRTDMTAWQSYKLTKIIERVYEKSILYQIRMKECGLLPENITNLDDLKKLPVTTKQDIAANYPYGLLTMPVSGVAYIHKTLEDQDHIAVSYTRNDMAMWSELMSRILVAGGVNVTSVFQWVGMIKENAPSLGVHFGIQQIGSTLLPDSRSSMLAQIHLIEDFGITSIFSTASHLLQLAQEAGMKGYKPAELPLQNIFCDSHLVSQSQSEKIQQIYGKKPIQVYGMYDIWGMGIAGECHCDAGLHVQEDCFYPEILHPISGQVLPIGEIGELVLTSLTLEAMPLLRFTTGMLCSLEDSPCACGRTLIRIRKETEKNDLYPCG